MVIYTPVPVEWVMGSSGEERQFTEIPYGQATVIAEVTADGACKVVRLISSNPDDICIPACSQGHK
jgi:hypothetical protein